MLSNLKITILDEKNSEDRQEANLTKRQQNKMTFTATIKKPTRKNVRQQTALSQRNFFLARCHRVFVMTG